VQIDRVAEDVYVMMSDLYAQVTSTIVLDTDVAVVIDTLPFPSETRQIQAFLEERVGPDALAYVILTHHHADHVFGAYLLGGEVIAHDACVKLMASQGPSMLATARQTNPALAEVELRLPGLSFRRRMHVHVGWHHLKLFHAPGHSPDGIAVFLEEEKILVAGDALMSIPYLVGGDSEQLKATLQSFVAYEPDFVVQGHGRVLLRGEVEEAVEASCRYIDAIVERVSELVRQGAPPDKLREIDIEACGMPRIALDGLVTRLHLNNLVDLYKRFSAELA
jgi:glyoxylase-like metal-dependent hydrolase (beta-lactamase superfamily II)